MCLYIYMCVYAFVYVCYIHTGTSHVPGASPSLEARDAKDPMMLVSLRS